MLSRFCFMRLNTAGLVIGWIGTIGSLIPIVILSIGLAEVNQIAEWIVNRTNSSNPDMNVDAIAKGLTFVFIVDLVIVAINLIASALLVYGTMKKRHLLLMPWLIESGLSLLLNVVYIGFFFFAQISLSVPFGGVLLWSTFSAIGLLFQFYTWYAIYSLYKDLRTNGEQYQRLINSNDRIHPSYTEA